MEKNKFHIIVVDDDDKIRSLIKQYLIEKGFLISTAENAENAKKIIEIMENAVSLEVPNKVDYETGKTWGDIYDKD